MNEYTIYCTQEQTLKAIELGASIEGIFIPTAEQMLGWLRSQGMKFYFNDITTLWQIVADEKIIAQGCSELKELASIDAALDHLIKNKK